MCEEETYIHSYGFNQTFSCVSLATTSDFRTLTVSPTLSEVSRRKVDGGAVNVASMLFQTNYLAIVMKANPYKVLLWDDSLAQPPHELWSRFEVLNVVLRRDVICIVSEYKIYVYEFGNSFSVLLHIETASNPKGLCAVSAGPVSNWVLACPGPSRGQLRIQLGLDDSVSSTVAAHANALMALTVSQDGALVASASEQGTVVKVFSSTDGQLLYEFRRGTTQTIISSLTFRPDNRFVVVGSASPTVHIFKLDTVTGKMMDKVAEWTGSAPPKYFQSTRSFAQFKIPETGSDLRAAGSVIAGPICCFANHARNHILVVHTNGLMYEGVFDEQKTDPGQECVLMTAKAIFHSRPDFRSSPAQSERKPAHEDESWQVI